MPLEGWSYRVEESVAGGAGKRAAVIQTVTVLWYKYRELRLSIGVRLFCEGRAKDDFAT
jgi:hypothetical protein